MIASCLSAWLLGISLSRVYAQVPLHAEGKYLRDRAGAVVILRGMNVAVDGKVPPFRVVDNVQILDPLVDWGVNVVRLLFTWEAFEPERGRYDESYLDYIAGLVDACQERGAYVVLDVHQDAFSRFSTAGCGEGFPRWAVPPDVTPDAPDNKEACATWNLQMITDQDTHRSWQAFHANEGGVRDRYLALLDRLGERFGRHPNVLGFDMLNEPWGDEPTEIGALYEAAARVLRGRAPDTVLFVSPHALTSGGVDTTLPRPSFGNFVYSPHYYDGAVLLLRLWTGADLRPAFDQMQAVATRWNAPLMLGELGAPADAQGALGYIDALYQELDRNFAAAAHWGFAAHWHAVEKDGWNREDLSVIDDRGQVRENYRVRPFAPRIAGTPEEFTATYSDRTRAQSVTLRWRHAPQAGSTRLFLGPPAIFGGAVRVELVGQGLRCELETTGLHLACHSKVEGAMSVRVLPCSPGDARCLAPMSNSSPAQERTGGGAADAGLFDSPPSDAGRARRSRQGSGCQAGATATQGSGALFGLLLLGALARSRRALSRALLTK
jgi:endoglycosylceramidase